MPVADVPIWMGTVPTAGMESPSMVRFEDIAAADDKDAVRAMVLAHDAQQLQWLRRAIVRKMAQPTPEQIVRYGIEPMRMDSIAKWCALGLEVLWVLILWGVWVAKMVGDGPGPYSHYFTNWMWTINTIYFTVDLLGYADWTGTVHFYWLYTAWWPFFGNVSAVFWLVIILLGLDPKIVIEAAEQYGWGATLVGERLVHVIPYFVAIVYGFLRYEDITDVLARFWLRTVRDRCIFAAYVLLMVLLSNMIILGYCANFDFQRVYGVHIPFWQAVILIEIIYVAFVVVPILLLSPFGARFRKNAFRRGAHTRVAMRLMGVRKGDEIVLTKRELARRLPHYLPPTSEVISFKEGVNIL